MKIYIRTHISIIVVDSLNVCVVFLPIFTLLDCINQRKDWKKDNTAVYYDSTIGITSVHLHCNHIASISDEEVEVYDGGWQSNTTKSRLNAIINGLCDGFTCGVYQHKFEWFITDDKLVHQFENGYTFARV